MLKYILKRLVMLIPVIMVTSFLIFWAMSLTGGDPALMLAGDNAKPEQIEQIREELGLNDPFIVRYGNYMKGMITGDMGQSYVTKRDVFKTFMERLPNTLMLGGAAVLIAVVVSLPLGIYTAIHQNTWKDTAGMIFALFGTSMPNFWLGLMLIIAFSVNLKWLPSSGFYGPEYWILPAITVGLVQAATVMRQTRSAMLDVVRQDYIRTAKAKGQTELKVVLGHALPNALIPIITVLGMQFGHGLGGAVISEQIFAIPGIGKLMVDSITARDYPVVQGGVLMIAISFTVVNLLVDILYAFIDPRIKALYVGKKAKRKQKEDGKGAAAA